jgi:hypothetical protein
MTMEEVKKIKKCKNGTEEEVEMILLKCPRPHCKKGEITIEKQKGYTNPFNHLVTCYSGEESLFAA